MTSYISRCDLILILLLGVQSVLSLSSLNYKILEELVPRAVIGNVLIDAHLVDEYKPAEIQRLRFDLIPNDHDHVTADQFFSVDQTSGIIRIKSVIDRDQEDLCAYQRTCDIKFDIIISPASFFRIIKVRVEILDINDNAPVFSRTEYRLNISETALPTTTYNLPSVFDLDSTDFGIKSIEILPDNERFQVIWSQDLKGHIQPKLRLMRHLDREEDPLFDLTIVAYDSGSPPKSADLLVHVFVQDTNDNSPVFDLPVYEARISENAQIGTPVLSIHAQDPDAGVGGSVRYSLSAPTLGESIINFRIDPISGEIYLAKEVDREVKDVYDIQVVAKDQAKEYRQASAPLTVYIDDVNDNPPVIRINVITSSGRAEVFESADPGTFVALVSVTDKDWGQNSEVICHLSSLKFRMDVMQSNTKFKVITESRLDREEQDEYQLSVSCQDRGIPSLTSSQTFLVHVIDINDNKPIFSKQQYLATVEENSPIGVLVLKLTTSDDDMAENAEVSYRILNDHGHMFTIDPEDGVIRTRAALDYELTPEVHLTVEARDHGNPVKSSTSVVVVKVSDVNDLAPEFSSSRYTFMIKENQLTDIQIGRVSATDRDTGSYKKFIFSLDTDSEDWSDYFSIDPDNGSLSLLRQLDREETSFYHLTIIARDKEPPALSSSTTVTIFVEDVNDNQPIVDFPNSYNNTALISNRLPPGYKVTQVRAHDPDVGDNAELSYFIVQDNDDETQRFGVDPKSGEVFLNYDLSKVKTAAYHVTILVKDNGTPEQSTLANLTVIVNQSMSVYRDDTEYLSDGNKTNNKNMFIIIIVVAISGVIIIVLLASIVFVLLTSRRKRANQRAAAASIVMDTINIDNNRDNSGADEKTIYNKHVIKQPSNGHHNDNKQTLKDHQRYVTLSNQPSLNLSNNSTHSDQRIPSRGGIGSKPPVPPRGVFVNYGSNGQKGDNMQVANNQVNGRSPEEIDRHSATSSEDSITDSGRGASEEGENGEYHRPPRLPPKQPLVASIRRQPIFPKLTPPYCTSPYPSNELSLEYPNFLQPDNTLYKHYQEHLRPDTGTNSQYREQRSPCQTELLLLPDFGLSKLQNEFDPHYRLKYQDLYTNPGNSQPENNVTDPCLSSNRFSDNALSFGESSDVVLNQSNYPQNKQTVRSVKAKDKSKKSDCCGSSLVHHHQPTASSSTNNLTGNSFNNANSVLRYNSQGGSTCSDITDGTSVTSATSGSYVIQHDDDDDNNDVGNYSRKPVSDLMH